MIVHEDGGSALCPIPLTHPHSHLIHPCCGCQQELIQFVHQNKLQNGTADDLLIGAVCACTLVEERQVSVDGVARLRMDHSTMAQDGDDVRGRNGATRNKRHVDFEL